MQAMFANQSSMTIFDRALVRTRRNRAASTFAAHRFLFDAVGDQMLERLGDVKREFLSVLDLGCHGGVLANKLAAQNSSRFVVRADMAENFVRQVSHGAGCGVVLDEEFLPFAPASFDLIVSNLSLHWVNDLPGTLLQIKQCLKPDGMFMAALLGGNTLHELRDCLLRAEQLVSGGVSPRLSPTLDLRDAAGLLQRAGFALPVADGDSFTVTYGDMFALLRDLRGMGETHAGMACAKTPTRRALFLEAARLYAEKYAEADGRITATFDIVWLCGWRG
jgi:NADH dehydrogenase [ubiquinone] 1 alpha subcomplex assembly factor 5